MRMNTIAEPLQAIQTTSGLRRIEELDMPLKFYGGNGELSVELNLAEDKNEA